MRKLTAATFFALSITAGGAGAAEINALISTAVAEAMAELVPQFERASGHTLRITYGPSGGLAKRLTGGEAADLIILNDTGLTWPWFVVRAFPHHLSFAPRHRVNLEPLRAAEQSQPGKGISARTV